MTREIGTSTWETGQGNVPCESPSATRQSPSKTTSVPVISPSSTFQTGSRKSSVTSLTPIVITPPSDASSSRTTVSPTGERSSPSLWDAAKSSLRNNSKCSINCRHAGRWPTPPDSRLSSPTSSLPSSPFNRRLGKSCTSQVNGESPNISGATSVSRRSSLNSSQPIEIPSSRRRNSYHDCLSRSTMHSPINCPPVHRSPASQQKSPVASPQSRKNNSLPRNCPTNPANSWMNSPSCNSNGFEITPNSQPDSLVHDSNFLVNGSHEGNSSVTVGTKEAEFHDDHSVQTPHEFRDYSKDSLQNSGNSISMDSFPSSSLEVGSLPVLTQDRHDDKDTGSQKCKPLADKPIKSRIGEECQAPAAIGDRKRISGVFEGNSDAPNGTPGCFRPKKFPNNSSKSRNLGDSWRKDKGSFEREKLRTSKSFADGVKKPRNVEAKPKSSCDGTKGFCDEEKARASLDGKTCVKIPSVSVLSRSLPAESSHDSRKLKSLFGKGRAAKSTSDNAGKVKNLESSVNGRKQADAPGNRSNKRPTGRVNRPAIARASAKRSLAVREDEIKRTIDNATAVPAIDRAAPESTDRVIDTTDVSDIESTDSESIPRTESTDRLITQDTDKLTAVCVEPTNDLGKPEDDIEKPEVSVEDRPVTDVAEEVRDTDKNQILQESDLEASSESNGSEFLTRDFDSHASSLWGTDIVDSHASTKDSCATGGHRGGPRGIPSGVSRSWHCVEDSFLDRCFANAAFDANRCERNGASETRIRRRRLNRSWDIDEEYLLNDFDDHDPDLRAIRGDLDRNWDEERILDDCLSGGDFVDYRQDFPTISRSWQVGECVLRDYLDEESGNTGGEVWEPSRKGRMKGSLDGSEESILDYFSPKSFDMNSEFGGNKTNRILNNNFSQESVLDDYFSVESFDVNSENGENSLANTEDMHMNGRDRTRHFSSSMGLQRIYKGGSLTNIRDGLRSVPNLRDSYARTKSLCNIHETLRDGFGNLGHINDLAEDSFGSVDSFRKGGRRHRQSQSVSNPNRECLKSNLSHWGSVPRLHSGRDSCRRGALESITWRSPREASGAPGEQEALGNKARGRGWERLRGRMRENRRKENFFGAFQYGGGEGEIEWAGRGNSSRMAELGWDGLLHQVLRRKGKAETEARREGNDGEGSRQWPKDVENPSKGWKSIRQKVMEGTPRPERGTGATEPSRGGKMDPLPQRSRRPPKFSEIFGGVEGMKSLRRRLKEEPSNRSEKNAETQNERTPENGGRWKYSGSESSCGATAEEPPPPVEVEEASRESGLGSSFEGESSGSRGSSRRSSSCPSTPSPAAPAKVFDAISHYFRTVDLVDHEDGIDSFSREAEMIDPEDLVLVTDNEEALARQDSIFPWGVRAIYGRSLASGYEELEANFSTGGDPVNFCENEGDRGLVRPMGNDFPSMVWGAGREGNRQELPFWESLAGSCDTVMGQEMGSWTRNGCQSASTAVGSPDEAVGPPDEAVGPPCEAVEPPDELDALDGLPNGMTNGSLANKPDDDKDIASLPELTNSLQTESSGGACDERRGRSRSRKSPDRSAASAERSVSCSDNVRAFLERQPCAHAHEEGGATHSLDCTDRHVLETGVSAKAEDRMVPHSVHEGDPQKGSSPRLRKKSRRHSVPRRPPNPRQRSKGSFWAKLFCTAPVTVEGLAPDLESHDTDPEPLPPPIPPHGVDPASITEVQPTSTSQPEDPEVMTADEAQRLLSAKESQSLLSDEEAQEVVLLLSPQEHNTSGPIPPVPQHFSDTPPAVPPHYAETAPPVPPHYAPGEDEYDTRVASHFDPTLTSPLSPEDEPSEADSSEASGDVYQVSRVKEVLVEDGVHYLEDGHFWVEVPGLPDEDEDDDNDPSMPYHPHTKLTFSKDPVQVFSTYSVTEYDRKNDEVDPVAASAEYELEKRVEKMDLFPVEIVKGEGGLGLSIIGMGVGADAGVEKLGIFVKTITQGGATERDGRIQVNDQIIEVDGKSLVGVTQVFAASVLKNTSGRVQFLIGREKDPENSEVALLIKQSLQADREREERRRALGGPDYDPHTGQSLFDPLSSPSEENSRSEDVSVQHNYSSYLEGASSPTSPDATSPPPEVFDLEGDTSDTSPDNDVSVLKLKLKELLEMEKVVTENTKYTSQLLEAQNKMADLDTQLQSKLSEVSTYQDMLEQSQGQFIVLEKKYYKAKKIIKEYQGRERDFLHREEYHITQLEEKDSHYNALVKALKDRVIQLEAELTTAQKKAGLPIQVPSDPSTQPAYWNLQQNTQSALTKQPPRKPSLCTLDPEISDTETSDTGTSEGDKSNTVERKIPVKEELDEAVPPHELLDVSASRAKGELASRGGLANRHLPSLKKTTSMSSASSQEQSLDDSSLDDDLPEAVKHPPVEATQDGQQDQGSRRELESDVTQQRNDREASPSKRSPTSLMEDVRQAVMQADVTSHVVSGQLVHQVSPSQRSQSSFYSTGGRESVRDGNTGSQSPRIGRSSLHASPGSGVSASPSGVVLLSQRPLDSSLPAHKLGPGVDGSSGDLSSGPASLGSGDEGSGASLGSQSSLSHTHPPTERTKRSHMWQTAPVVDWTKEQVSQWLVVQGLESCVGRFQDVGMTGPRLLNLDVRDLKALGLPPEEKTKLKRKVKELRIAVEKERKQAEKEKKEREKLQKKAEKLAEKAEKKKK